MKLEKEIDEERNLLNNRAQNQYISSQSQNFSNSCTQNTIEINAQTTHFDLYKGIFFMIISCLFKSVYSILLKYTMNKNTSITPFQLMTWRTYIMIWLCGILGIFCRNQLNIGSIDRKSFSWAALRSLLAVVSTPLVICSLKELHISDVYSIFYIYPGLIILFYLGANQKKVGFFDYICLISCFIGVLFIVKPDILFVAKPFVSSEDHISTDSVYSSNPTSFYRNKYFFFILVGIAAVVKALEDICVKEAGKQIHSLIYCFMYVFFGMMFFPVIVIFNNEKMATLDTHDYILFLFIAITSMGYISFMALGLQNENAGRVSMINYFQVVFMYLSDIILFSKSPTVIDFLGTMLIFTFNTANGVYKAMRRSNTLERCKNKKESI